MEVVEYVVLAFMPVLLALVVSRDLKVRLLLGLWNFQKDDCAMQTFFLFDQGDPPGKVMLFVPFHSANLLPKQKFLQLAQRDHLSGRIS